MTDKKKNSQDLRAKAFDLETSLFGVAGVTALREEFDLRQDLKARFDYAVSIGKRLSYSVLDDIRDAPTPLYFHHYRQVNAFLDRLALRLADYIQGLGFQALPIPASQIIDWERQRGHLSHKKVGEMAGLGWRGRNNLLVSPEFGARFRLVTVLTDFPMETDKPLDSDCGTCRACLARCPAGAIREKREDFDHLACYEKLKEFRDKGLVGQFICGICVKACRGVPVKS